MGACRFFGWSDRQVAVWLFCNRSSEQRQGRPQNLPRWSRTPALRAAIFAPHEGSPDDLRSLDLRKTRIRAAIAAHHITISSLPVGLPF